MSRNRPQLERASLAQAITTALRRSRYPLPTADVIASVVNILGYGDRSLGAVVVQVRRCLRHMEGRGVLMTGIRGKRLWHVAQED
jgi:hypothetical protein